MPFKALLNRMLDEIPGSLGAIIVDWEGEAVDQVARIDEYDIKVMGAHNGVILQLMRDALERTASGQLQELTIRTDRARLLMVPLTAEYLLVVHLGPDALVPRAARATRWCVAELRDDFDF